MANLAQNFAGSFQTLLNAEGKVPRDIILFVVALLTVKKKILEKMHPGGSTKA